MEGAHSQHTKLDGIEEEEALLVPPTAAETTAPHLHSLQANIQPPGMSLDQSRNKERHLVFPDLVRLLN